MDSNKIKKGLGRGLSSLIGETKVESQKNQLSISDLTRNKYQPNLHEQTPARELVKAPEEYSWSIFTNDAVSTPSSPPQAKAQHKNHMTSIT